MPTQQSICAILNPAAGNGQAGKEKYRIEKLLSKHFANSTIWETQGPRHATVLAKKAADDGFDIVAAIGGDGSCHEVVNGLMQAPEESRPILAIIPFGTGGDFRKSLDIPKSIDTAIAIAAKGNKQTIDIGTATVTTDSGTMERFFVNVAGFGANGEVAEKSNRWSKRFGGRVTFLNATIHTTFTYRSPKVQMKWTCADGTDTIWTGELLSCFIANASFCGGGMRVAPKNALGDGQLHLRLLPKLSVPSQLMHLPKLYSDEIYKIEGSVVGQTIRVEAAPVKGSIVQIDLDGELSGRLPAVFGLSLKSLTVMRR